MVDSPGQFKLLVVDDDEVSRRLVGAIFRPEGVEVSAAADGSAGLKAALGGTPDVVLLDLEMPGTHGLEVLERLKQERPSLAVIILTAEHDVKSAVSAMKLG